MRITNILMLGSLIAIALPSVSVRAIEVDGSFDWSAEGIEFLDNGEINPLIDGDTYSGSAIFNFEKEPFKIGDVTFTIEEFNNQTVPPILEEFDVTSANFAEDGDLVSFVFSRDDMSNGIVDFSNPTDSSKSFFVNSDGRDSLKPSNLRVSFKSKTIPEPSTIFGLTTVLVGAIFTRKKLINS
ncbi:MAG: PEP-CTERM sorting domain-containing protein [Rivularia sp. (in: cyanobacteria)]